VHDEVKVKEQQKQQHYGKKKKNGQKELKEARRSISRAREQHLRNINEINKINNSVKYSPRRPAA